MVIDRDSTRAAKARRRAQRLARLATARPMRGPNVFTHVPAQPAGTDALASEASDEASEEGTDRSDEDTAPPLGIWTTPELPENFITADALAGQGSEAERLQADLAGVRQMLDRPLPPVQARARRRIGPGFWLGLVLLIFVVGAVLAVLVVTGMSPFGSRSDSSSPTTAPANTTPANTTPADTGQVSTGPAVGGQVAGLPTAGPGVDQEGAALGIQVLADQSIAVTEQAVLAAPGLGSFNLTVPQAPELTGDASKLHPLVQDLKITLNGSPATATQTDERNWTVVSPVGGAQTVRLTYRLADSVIINQPSTQGRALALVTPLLAELLHAGNQPVDLLIPADGVGNVTCVGAPQAESLCGAHRGPNWLVTIPDDATSAAVTLQLTLR